jgi:hypothetical protein
MSKCLQFDFFSFLENSNNTIKFVIMNAHIVLFSTKIPLENLRFLFEIFQKSYFL